MWWCRRRSPWRHRLHYCQVVIIGKFKTKWEVSTVHLKRHKQPVNCCQSRNTSTGAELWARQTALWVMRGFHLPHLFKRCYVHTITLLFTKTVLNSLSFPRTSISNKKQDDQLFLCKKPVLFKLQCEYFQYRMCAAGHRVGNLPLLALMVWSTISAAPRSCSRACWYNSFCFSISFSF